MSLFVAAFTVLPACESQQQRDYSTALDCYENAMIVGALGAAGEAMGLETSSSLGSELGDRWQSKVLVTGGAAGRSQDEIADDLMSRLKSAMTHEKAILNRDNHFAAESFEKAQQCIKSL